MRRLHNLNFTEERRKYEDARAPKDVTDVLYDSPLVIEYGFQMWILAKLDAMPVADFHKRQTHTGSAWTYSGAPGGSFFDELERAEAHAIKHGFRLLK